MFMPDDVDSLAVLMRATTLHAVLLSGGAAMPAIHLWRARCIALAEEFRQSMQDIDCPATTIDEASLAQCVLLDELTLRALRPAQRSEWMRDPLQVHFHSMPEGAALVWTRIDALLRDERRDRAMLALYGIVLELGFDGGRKDPDVYRRKVRSLLSRLGHSALPSRVEKSVESITMMAAPFPERRTSSARWLIFAAIIAVSVLWVAFDANLNTKVGQLPTAPAASSDRLSEKGT